MKARITIASMLAVAMLSLIVGVAVADEPLADGDYSITLTDGVIEFTVSDGGSSVLLAALPSGFSETTDADSSEIEITNGTVTIEIRTGDDGKIKVEGLESAADVVVVAPDGVTVELDEDNGSIEIQTDDEDSDDAESTEEDELSDDESTDDDALKADDKSDDEESDDDVTDTTVASETSTSTSSTSSTTTTTTDSDDDSDDSSDDDSDDSSSG